MTRPSLADLRRNQVRTFGEHTMVPGLKESAADFHELGTQIEGAGILRGRHRRRRS